MPGGVRRLPRLEITGTQIPPALGTVEIPDTPLKSANKPPMESPREAASLTQTQDFERSKEDVEEEATQILRRKVSDPFVAKPPRFKLPAESWYRLVGVPLAAFSLVILCEVVDYACGYGFSQYTFWNFFDQFGVPMIDPRLSKKIMKPLTVLQSFMYGVVLSIVGMVLELASKKFSGALGSVLFRDWKILGAVGYVVFVNILTHTIHLTIGSPPNYVPRTAPVLCLILTSPVLSGVFIFMDYVFYFMDPHKVVSKIVSDGILGVIQSVEDEIGENVGKYQHRAINSVEHLRNVGYKAIKKKDKIISAKAVDALCSFGLMYQRYKDQMFKHWFFIPTWVRLQSDFLTLPDESIQTWMEWKILRVYLELFNESVEELKEVCYHIAMNTRIIGEAAGAENGDVWALDLSIKIFNTYLRTGINKSAGNTVYTVLFQYRKLAESLLEHSRDLRVNHYRQLEINPNNNDLSHCVELEKRVMQIAKFMRLHFLVEVIAHDIRSLCESALRCKSPIHDRLLGVFLTVFDKTEPGGDKALKGVRRAQICLATSYLAANQSIHAREIYEDFSDEPEERLNELMSEMTAVTNREFWEVSQRGTNFYYISDEQRAQLPLFFSWFKNFKGDSSSTPPKYKKVQDL